MMTMPVADSSFDRALLRTGGLPRPAIFLDRDGVLIDDVDLLTQFDEIRILPGIPQALLDLRAAGYPLVVVTNQPVVARGMIDEPGLRRLHDSLDRDLRAAGATIDAWYYCPHHPNANLPEYRVVCDCRKPRGGMLKQAAADLGLDLAASVMIGDRLTDIAAGAAAGCRTILVRSGKHLAPLIETAEPLDPHARGDYECDDLAAATRWILSKRMAA